MIIIPSAVKSNQTITHQFFDLGLCRINHTDNRLSFAFNLPVNQKEIWKDLNIIKYHLGFFVYVSSRRFGRFELHLIHKLNAVIGLICAACREGQYRITHIRNVVFQTVIVCVLKKLVNIIDAWFRIRMILFIEVPFDHCSKNLFVFNTLPIEHFLFSFQW